MRPARVGGKTLRHSLVIGLICALGLTACQVPDPKVSADELSEVLRRAGSDAQAAYDYAAATRHFQKLNERKPTDIPALQSYARNLRYSGRPRDAVRMLRARMAKVSPDPRLLLELGKAQLASSILGEARSTLKRAALAAPQSWDAQASLGIAHDRLGEFKLARQAYDRALALSQDNAAVLNNLALSWALAGQIDKGIVILERVVANETATALTRQNLALLHGITGNVDRAKNLGLLDLEPTVVDENIATLKMFGNKAPITPIVPSSAKLSVQESPPAPPAESTQSLEW